MIEIFFPSNWTKADCEDWGRRTDHNWFVLSDALVRGWNGRQFWFSLMWRVQLP